MSKETASITSDQNFTLTMSRGDEPRERIGIRNEYPSSELSRQLFQSLGLMYLVAPYFPERITTDFYVPEQFRDLIGAMYHVENREQPYFFRTNKQIAEKNNTYIHSDEVNAERFALTYSGGKDSMWNLHWLEQEYGLENVLAVHLQGMNKVSGVEEYEATLRQQKHIGFPLAVVNLLNSSKNHGKNVMRARDMFIVGLTVPLALEFHAGSVVLEGGFWPDENSGGQPFTTYESSWKLFNELLTQMRIPIQAVWQNCSGMKAVEDLLRDRPDWLPMVYNCFSPACFKGDRQEKWEKVAFTFPLYEGQCGSCAKCREVNIARIIYDPIIQKANWIDVKTYVRDTVVWARKHKIDQADVLEGSFTEHLHLAAEKYCVKVQF